MVAQLVGIHWGLTHQFAHPQNSVDGCANLVGDVGQKLRLDRFGAFRLASCLDRLRVRMGELRVDQLIHL